MSRTGNEPVTGHPSARVPAIEALLLFGGVPLLFLFDLPRGVTPAIMLLSFVYVAVQAIRNRLIPKRSLGLNGFRRFGPPLLLFAVFAVVSTVVVALLEPERLFSVVRTNPGLWLLMLVVYCLFSVYPQTLVFALTFCGGILFGRTWLKSHSALAVSIEHALYGFWLFTVGLGGYFAFPGG